MVARTRCIAARGLTVHSDSDSVTSVGWGSPGLATPPDLPTRLPVPEPGRAKSGGPLVCVIQLATKAICADPWLLNSVQGWYGPEIAS